VITVRAKARKLVGRRLPQTMTYRRMKRILDRTQNARLAALLATLALASGCAHDRVITTPDVCPALPAAPAVASVVLPLGLPYLDGTLTDPEAIAGDVLRVRVDSAALYQTCLTNRAALLEWIKAHSTEQ
jgi:hypothetical protein